MKNLLKMLIVMRPYCIRKFPQSSMIPILFPCSQETAVWQLSGTWNLKRTASDTAGCHKRTSGVEGRCFLSAACPTSSAKEERIMKQKKKNIFFFYPYGCTFSADDLPGAFACLPLHCFHHPARKITGHSASSPLTGFRHIIRHLLWRNRHSTRSIRFFLIPIKTCGAESANASVYQKELTEQLKNCSVDGVSDLTIDFTKKKGL